MDGGALMREARRRAGLTQQQLADRIGRPQSQIARWEAGKVSPRVDALNEVVRACDLSLVPRLLPRDDDSWSLVVQNLARTPQERFDKAVAAARFVQRGRRAVSAAKRG